MAKLDLIAHALRVSSGIARDVLSEPKMSSVSKGDRSPVTAADLAIQIAVSRFLKRQNEQFWMLGEEDADVFNAPGNAGLLERVCRLVSRATGPIDSTEARALLAAPCPIEHGVDAYWILDPIDGTKGFLRRAQFAVALAYCQNGQITSGGLGCPELDLGVGRGTICLAQRGAGAWRESMDGSRRDLLTVSSTSRADHITLCQSVEKSHSSHSWSAGVMAQLGSSQAPLAIDSQAKYAAVAHGLADAYLRLPVRAGYQEKVWDHAAGYIVVTEAGGVVTDIDGASLNFGEGRTLASTRGLVVTNGHIHQRVLDAVSEACPSP